MNTEVLSTKQAWEKYGSELSVFILSKVKNRYEAEDILQEVFLKVHLNLSSLKNQTRLKSWIYQVTRNTIQDYFRKKRFSRDIETIDLAEEPVNEAVFTLQSCMKPFIEKLPSKYREALILSDFNRMSQTSLAQKLRISYSGAKSRVQRARKLLSSYFTDCCDISADKYGNIVSQSPKIKCLCNC